MKIAGPLTRHQDLRSFRIRAGGENRLMIPPGHVHSESCAYPGSCLNLTRLPRLQDRDHRGNVGFNTPRCPILAGMAGIVLMHSRSWGTASFLESYRIHIGALACRRKPGSATGNCERAACPAFLRAFPGYIFISRFISICDIEYFQYLYIPLWGRTRICSAQPGIPLALNRPVMRNPTRPGNPALVKRDPG
jgi:hypothetical protein